MSRRRGHSSRRGFTLLEVLISVAILALGMASVFGSSIMAARGTAHARMVTQAALLAQCRMTQVEAYLRQNQLPVDEQRYDDPPEMGGERCCESPFTCDARVELIELPSPDQVGTAAGDRLLGAASNAARGQRFGGAAGDGGVGSAIGQLAGALGNMSAGGGLGAGLPGGGLAGAGAPDLQGMAAQLLAGIYPTIKPMLEGAIRKVTIAVKWREGSREFGFDVVQYVTNPGQSMQSGAGLDALERALGGAAAGAAGGAGTGSGTGTSGSSTGGTRGGMR